MSLHRLALVAALALPALATAAPDLVYPETRKGDVVCRHGGEEFLVICAGSTLEMGAATAERIRSAVEENAIKHGLGRNVTVSCGVATLGQGVETVDELLKALREEAKVL